MSNAHTARRRGRFDVALIAGLSWGCVGVFAVSAAFFAYVGLKVDAPAEHLLMLPIAAGRVALVAAFVGILPTSLFAGALGWGLYRAGVVSRWAYMVVGALSAFLAVGCFDFLVAFSRGDRAAFIAGADDPSLYMIFYLPPVLVGAFGGYMGGRVIERGAAQD